MKLFILYETAAATLATLSNAYNTQTIISNTNNNNMYTTDNFTANKALNTVDGHTFNSGGVEAGVATANTTTTAMSLWNIATSVAQTAAAVRSIVDDAAADSNTEATVVNAFDGVSMSNTMLHHLLNYTNETLFMDDSNNYNNDSSNLLSTTETPYIPYVMRPETYIVPVLFAFIFIVGILGNGTLIVVFLGVRQMRNVPNTYILSLALADMLVIITTVPLTSTVYTVDTWPWGSFLCTFSEFVKDVSIGVSVFTLTALAGDRYFAIVDPLRKFHAHGGGKRATRMTIAIAISIWILAILCGLPALIGSYVKIQHINSNKSFSFCYPFPEEWGSKYAKTMVLLRFLVYYAIPLIIIGVFYILIARHLMYAANVPGEMQGAVRQVRARRKVAVTVLAFVVIFGICFLPYHVFMLWFYYWPTAQQDYNSFWHVLRILGFCLSFANSCANPVALYFVSGAFRKHFNRYLFCQDTGVRHKKRHHNDTMCMHRDTSLTSTTSKRYHSRRSCYQSTIRSRMQETTITVLPNGNHNGCSSNLVTTGGTHASNEALAVPLTSDYCHQHQHQHQHPQQKHLRHQQQQHQFM